MKEALKFAVVFMTFITVLNACSADPTAEISTTGDGVEITELAPDVPDISGTLDAIKDQTVDIAGDAASTVEEEVPNLLERATELIPNLAEQSENSDPIIPGDYENGLEEVQLVYVVDGDTLVVLGSDNLEYKVRLIGIDTPESVHSDAARNNEFGVTASEHTKEILKDIDTLYLEYDVDPTDKYNRTLAYVWLSSNNSDINNMLNAKILADGYAIDKVYEPNHKYADVFATICQQANDSHAGLWQTEGYHKLVNR